MGANTNGSAMIQHYDLVSVANSANTLRHYHQGSAAQLAGQSGPQPGVGLIIQRRKRIIKNQYLRLAG